MENSPLHFRIVSPKKVLFDGEAESVSAKNSSGKFDILPGHANMVTIIEGAPIRIKVAPKQEIKFDIQIAVLTNANNQVNIYTDIQDPNQLTKDPRSLPLPK